MTENLKPHPLLLEFLAWVARTPRSYAEAMDAWRTSCPRLSVWEDACLEGLVAIEAAADGAKENLVRLTASGRTVLERTNRRAAPAKEMNGGSK